LQRKRFLVRVDALHDSGLAHIVRCKNILSLLNHEIDLFVLGKGDISSFFPTAEIIIDNDDSAPNIVKYAISLEIDFTIVDLVVRDNLFWDYLSENIPTPLIVIDDYGGDVQGDLIINGTILSEYHNYPEQKRNSLILCGKNYSQIHPFFSSKNWDHSDKKILSIIIGGGDRATAWAHSLVNNKKTHEQWDKIFLVVGSSFPSFEVLSEECKKNNITIKKGISSQDLAVLLSTTTIALVTGGMIVYECLAIGVPTVVFPQELNLIKEIDYFSKNGCVVNLTYEDGMNSDLAIQTAKKLLFSPEKMKKMSHLGKEMIDGKGVIRAAEAIKKMMNN